MSFFGKIVLKDLKRLTFRGEKRRIYGLGEDTKIYCYVEPESVYSLPGFEYGWYSNGFTEAHRLHELNSKTYSVGSHKVACAAPAHTNTTLDWEFFITDNRTARLILKPDGSDCSWADSWMNDLGPLNPSIYGEISGRGRNNKLRLICEYRMPGLDSRSHQTLDLPADFNYSLIVTPTKSQDVYILGEEKSMLCFLASRSVEKLFKPHLIWNIYSHNITFNRTLYINKLDEGKYKCRCQASNLNMLDVNVDFFVVSKNAKIVLADESRSVFKRNEKIPACMWASPFMNSGKMFNISVKDFMQLETKKITKISRTCFYKNHGIEVKYTKNISIVDPENMMVVAVPSMNIFSTNTTHTAKVSCELSPSVTRDSKLIMKWIAIMNSRIVSIDGYYLIHNTSAIKDKVSKEIKLSDIFGSYICAAFFWNKTLTYIYTLMIYEPIESVRVSPRSREIMNLEKITCVSFGAKYVEAYSLLSIKNIKTEEFINFPTINLIQINVDRPVRSLISCKINQIYFSTVLSSETIDTVMILMPQNYTQLKRGANFSCTISGARDVDFVLSAKLLKAPDYMKSRDVGRQISRESFTSGEYSVGCILSDKDGILWIDEYELSQVGKPEHVFLSENTVDYDVKFRCNSDGFPVQLISSKIQSWNQSAFLNLTDNSSEASFSRLTDYGTFSMGCLVEGLYLGNYFSLAEYLTIDLTGPFYELENLPVINKQESVIILLVLQVIIFFIISGLFLMLFHSSWIAYQKNRGNEENTLDENYFNTNVDVMSSEYYGISADEMQPSDLIKVMSLITLYDTCYEYRSLSAVNEDSNLPTEVTGANKFKTLISRFVNLIKRRPTN